MNVEAALREAYRDMDPHTGMFPADWTCQGCGKVLDADGGHPAELYAGTYTGLCYACERAPVRLVRVDPLDGARLMSHAPACPSWRRDRTEHWAYEGCPDCGGEGARREFVGLSRGDVTRYCRTCHDRYHDHPLRAWRSRHGDLLRRAAEARHERVLRREARLPRRASRKAFLAAVKALPDQVKVDAAASVLESYRGACARMERVYALRVARASA